MSSPQGRGQGARPLASRWITADVTDFASVHRMVEETRPSVVFHLASVVNLERSPEVARACFAVNTLGTIHLLQALRQLQTLRVVYASTTEVYGDNPTPFQEGQLPNPPSPYAVSKLAAEHFCRLAWRVDGVPAVVARMTATYGPGQASHRLITSLIRAALTQQPLEVSHAGQQRDWLYVDDAVDGLLAVARCPLAVGEVVNLGSTILMSTRELGARIERLLDTAIPVTWHEAPQRAGEAEVWSTDASRARDWCGWTPRYSLDEGLRETIAWHQAHLSQDARTR